MAVSAWSAAAGVSAQTLTFSRGDYEASAGPRGIVAADFNRDGAIDLALSTNGSDAVTVLLNRTGTGGGFVKAQDIPLGGGPFDIAAGDLNDDNVVDLAVANADSNSIDIILGEAEGGFAPPDHIAATGNPRGIAIADMDGDGRADIVYSQFYANSVQVLHGDGSGSGFVARGGPARAGARPQGLAIDDFNRDGRLDIAVANSGADAVTVLYQTADGVTYQTVRVPGQQYLNVLTVGDFNGDGRPDIAAASTPRNLALIYLNRPTGLSYTSAVATGASPRGIRAADLNKDGRLDLVTANRGANNVTAMLGRVDVGGTFSGPLAIPAGNGARAVALADFNVDGQMDIATGNEYGASATVLTNTSRPPANVFWRAHALPAGDFPGDFVSLADFNKNGRVDVVTNRGVTLDGIAFVPISSGLSDGSDPVEAVTGDFNRDGNADLVMMTRHFRPFRTLLDLYRGDGQGSLTYVASFGGLYFPEAIRAADINRDGKLDLIVVDSETNLYTLRVLLGDGKGFSAPISSDLPPLAYGFDIDDVNRDGRLDAIVAMAGTSGGVHVAYGDGTGRFGNGELLPRRQGAQGVEAADLNHDGRIDLLAAGSGVMTVWLGAANGTFVFSADYSAAGSRIAVGDLTADGHPDVFMGISGLFAGRGDGTFRDPQPVNVPWIYDAETVDYDHDGRTDVVITTGDLVMAILSRGQRGENLPPVADAGRDRIFPYEEQFDDYIGIGSVQSYDPNLDPIAFEWTDSSGRILATDLGFFLPRIDPRTHMFTLTVRDGRGGESSDTMTVTITPMKEAVSYARYGGFHGAWRTAPDATAADEARAWHPNANAPKLTAPLASPVNYVDVYVLVDPTQQYKLWVRLKAENNSWANDSIFVQFEDGATTADGRTRFAIGTNDAFSVNLEQCSGCGVSGWGWRDERWGPSLNSAPLFLKFARGGYHRLRIQTREDGVSVDQVVLSAQQYRAAPPGAPKNDATILPPRPW